MALFPQSSSAPFAAPVTKSIQYKTTITQFSELGGEQRKRQWLYPRRNIKLTYNHITPSQAKTLWSFFMAHSGAYTSFSWIDSETNTYAGEYVATGDGATDTFSLPSKTATAYKVYLDGIEQTETTNYTLTHGAGADGEDQVQFTVAPNDGARITYDFTGLLKVRCVFADDACDFDTFWYRLVTMGLNLRGLLNA